MFLIAHPYLERSRANRAVLEAVRDVPGVRVRNLYDLYPYFHIDVEEEQRQMLEHDLIVVQHPFVWYNMPALLKLWLDEVWYYGFSYGPGGDKLKGKKFLLSITTGGAQNVYPTDGDDVAPMETLLSPWTQTVRLCGMKWHEPKIIDGSIHSTDQDVRRHALEVRAALETFAKTGVLK
jgi:putative NADPH-quinone reductase